MNNQERLIPFLGGLIVGGVGGAAVEGNKMMPYGYYPPYYNNYQYPVYNYYPQYYPTQQSTTIKPYQTMPQTQNPYNQTMYPQYYNPYGQPYYQYYNNAMNPVKIVNETPTEIATAQNERTYNYISEVPKYL